MGAKTVISAKAPRVVLDTNTLISALLFSQGKLTRLRKDWQARRIVPLVNRDTTRELLRILNYPKFDLTRTEQNALLEDFLPWAETVAAVAVPKTLPTLRDPNDVMFLALAVTAHAEYLVSGDKDLLVVRNQVEPLKIMTPAEFLKVPGAER